MTAQASLQSAVQAVNAGAYYYLQKPFANDELLAICRRAAEARQLKVENKELKKEIRLRSKNGTHRPTGQAREFVDVLKLAETVAPTDSTVLIGGESGTGKEVVSRFIHALSHRAEQPFFSINCGALTESLLERASCSATSKARSPAPSRTRKACWLPPRVEPSSWMRSVSCRLPCRSSSSGYSRSAK